MYAWNMSSFLITLRLKHLNNLTQDDYHCFSSSQILPIFWSLNKLMQSSQMIQLTLGNHVQMLGKHVEIAGNKKTADC